MEINSDEIARLVYLLLILLSISGWFLVSLKQNLGKTVQMALIWGLIFLGFFGVYGVWEDISNGFKKDEQYDKITENIFQIRKSSDGHFYTSARINDNPIKFLIDTGATKTILSLTDASAAGINISKLVFDRPMRTANGIAYSARYQVENFNWLEKDFDRVSVQITDGELFRSLLGMDIIEKSETFLISGDLLQLSFK